MAKKRHTPTANLAFIDMLSGMSLLFSVLFVVLLIQQSAQKTEEVSKKAVELKAEFVVSLTWDDYNCDDIDLWLKAPNGTLVGYPQRDSEYITLDRDDRGCSSDAYMDGEVRKLVRLNKEMLTVRAIAPGKYVVNVNVFSTMDAFESFKSEGARLPYSVKIQLTKLNPTVKEWAPVSIEMTRVNRQKTAFSFVVDKDGNVQDYNVEEDVPFIPIAGYGS